ncbi:MAG: hypothetical protein JSR59_26080 [Proteobacteria bacterium]|nr:hypothetical protein [Pseudomonadota bacterium]
MVIALLALVVLLVGAVALMRSFNASSLVAGNIAVKRDLQNQGERGIAAAAGLFASGGALADDNTRANDQKASNYISYQLASNAQGIPLVLVNDSTYATLGLTASDITDSTTGVVIRYVIDRQCVSTGTYDPASCQAIYAPPDKRGSAQLLKPGGPSMPAYRITVRVTDTRRNTQTYLQTIAGI